ncbi:MAG: hypothetical protein FWE44_03925 [Defluviitaleaceae bacterium]|nr:hypothetical protein [Defluviitaleaceae bacterium]
MKYNLCIKENDSSLLHIIRQKDMPRFGGGMAVVSVHKNEQKSYEAVRELVEDFCKLFWDKGKEPNFRHFKKWARRTAKQAVRK